MTPINPELLLVDDDPLLRLDMADRLHRRGFTVRRARQGDQALRIMEKHPAVRAVFSDLQMPGAINGLELLRLISKRWPGRRLILISGWSSPRSSEMPPGALFLLKPVSRTSLDRVLEGLNGPGEGT